MKRTIYQNNYLVDQIMLNNLENSKIDEIIRRQKTLGNAGVVSGLKVTPFNQGTNVVSVSVTVSAGTAVLPSGEVVVLENDQTNLILADTSFGAFNLVLLNYSETLSLSRENEREEDEQDLLATVTPTITIVSIDDFLDLSVNQDFLIIAIITAQGNGVNLSTSNILNAEFDSNIYNFDDLNVLKGVIIKSTTVDSTDDYGQIRYDFTTQQIRFVSPNNTNTITGVAGRFVDLTQDVTNIVLEDSDVPGDSITVDIYGTSLPESTSSFTSAQLLNLQTLGLISGNLVQERIDFSNLYQENLIDVDNDTRIPLAKSSAKDVSHREKLGIGFTQDSNPHGISLGDILKIFDKIPGSITLGDGLLSIPEEIVYPRIRVSASENSPYLLVLETELPNQGSLGIAPIRLYANSFNPLEILDSQDLSNVQLSGFSLTFNARYDSESNLWVKDNAEFSQIPAIKVELGSDSFNVSMNQGDVQFADPEGWTNKLLTNVNYNFFRDALAISPRNDFILQELTGMINAAQAASVSRPFSVPIYEDVNGPNGGLRIYFGENPSDGTGFPKITFYLNAKPNLGNNTWTKDVAGNPDTGFLGYAYFFSFEFVNSIFETGQYTGNTITFSSWDKQEINFEGGLQINPGGTFEGSFLIQSIRYQDVRSRVKIINHGDVGYSADPDFQRIAFHPNPGDVDEDDPDRYFRRSPNSTTFMGYGIPAIIDIENRRKNIGVESNTPRLVWRGPEKDFWKSDDSNAANNDICYIGTRSPSAGQFIKFIFPIFFEEEEIMLKKITIPWDWENEPDDATGLDLTQTFDFQDTYQFPFNVTTEPWFAVRLFRTNILTGTGVDISPVIPNCIQYDTLIANSPADEMALFIEHPSDVYFQTLLKSNLGEYEVYQLHVSTNAIIADTDKTYRTYGTSTPGASEGQVFQMRPIIIGNCVIEYDTFNIE